MSINTVAFSRIINCWMWALRQNIARTKKIATWKASGPDGVQGYWVKNLKSMHRPLRKQLEQSLEEGTPGWMPKGRTILIQKDKKQGNAASNYRPITCLPILWKLLTGSLPKNYTNTYCQIQCCLKSRRAVGEKREAHMIGYVLIEWYKRRLSKGRKGL